MRTAAITITYVIGIHCPILRLTLTALRPTHY